MSEALYAWEVSHSGITAKVVARNRARARYIAAESIVESGFASSIGEAFQGMRCRRAPEHDVLAETIGKEAVR